GRKLLYPFGPAVGLGFLATTRRDGGPRVHPVCPAILGGGLYVFVIGDSPKRADLARDGRYALHFYPDKDDDESFYCTGPAREVEDRAARAAAIPGFAHAVRDDEVLFELRLSRALHTTWERPRTPATRPIYRSWRA
ncbi:MAG TPA: pyridoxamine 5'-phosphate oxidase family protein, partial [Myxococcota bacterium]|nr:pyridoxamine 5'-phosphate oxidase family protein [Myxococcota bacterium]